jgi:hypothetical protein
MITSRAIAEAGRQFSLLIQCREEEKKAQTQRHLVDPPLLHGAIPNRALLVASQARLRIQLSGYTVARQRLARLQNTTITPTRYTQQQQLEISNSHQPASRPAAVWSAAYASCW